MLEEIVAGWDSIEPVFLANVALRKPFMLLGRHGVCKTTVAKQLSRIYGSDGFRFYDCTKDDLISIAGIPIPEQLAQGKLEFSRHDRTIWEARVIVVDELTRANKENQNLWLEILEEKTCFGKELHYECLIATMNPESYASTFKLDQALLDRFYAVVPVPELQQGTPAQVYERIIRMNLSAAQSEPDIEAIRQRLAEIRSNYKKLTTSEVVETVAEYVGNFMEILLSQTDCYVSPRKAVQLSEEILALGAGCGSDLDKAAQLALTYTLSVPLQIEPGLLLQIHENIKPLLLGALLPEDKLRLELGKLCESDELLCYLEQKAAEIAELLPYDEVETLLAKLQSQLSEHSPAVWRLQQVLAAMEGHEEQQRQAEGKAVLYLIARLEAIVATIADRCIYSRRDVEMKDKVKAFLALLESLPLPQETLAFLFSEAAEDHSRVISFIEKGEFQ